MRLKAYKAAQRAAKKGAANRGRRAGHSYSKASANFVCQSRSTKKFTRRTASGQCRKGSTKIRV